MEPICALEVRCQTGGLNNKSRLSREAPDRICESLRVRFPWATRLIITGESKELLENKIKPAVEKFLQIRGLSLSQKKTRITHVEEGFDFLGFNLRWMKNKLIIKPAKAKVKAVSDKIRLILRKGLHRQPGEI